MAIDIVSFPIKKCDFPSFLVGLPSYLSVNLAFLRDLRLVWFWSIPIELGWIPFSGANCKFPIFPSSIPHFWWISPKIHHLSGQTKVGCEKGTATQPQRCQNCNGGGLRKSSRNETHPRHLYIHCITHISSPWCWNMHLPTELPERPKSPSFVGKCTSTMEHMGNMILYDIII